MKDGQLNTQMMITLLFLFLGFVVVDVATTQWLILNSPGGMVNEINPIGILLYNSFGAAGMIFPKFVMFILFAAMTMYFTARFSYIRWFVEVAQTLLLAQVALSLIVSFNNFVAILAVLFVKGQWPIANITRQVAVLGIFLADIALGSIFANGIMYMWGMTRRAMHLKVFVGLLVFITPVLLFSGGFRTQLWVFALYVAAASTALGLGFYLTEVSRSLKRHTSAS